MKEWQRTALSTTVGLTGVYALVVLFTTPRGDRICERMGRIMFPPFITGEQPPRDINNAPLDGGQP